MSSIQYTQTAHLSDGHSKGITSVTFNPDGSLLATSGLDGTVCIWDTKTWLLLDIYYAKTAVSTVAWFNNSALVCGLEDGILSCLVKSDNGMTCVSGFWAHDPPAPVEHISPSGRYVASGAHTQLLIWDWNTNTSLSSLVTSIKSPEDGAGEDKKLGVDFDSADGREVLITGIFWTATELIVTYLNHGIRFFSKDKWTSVRVIDTDRPIVSSSLSPDGTLLASSNLVSGFDIYNLDSGMISQSYEYPPGTEERAIPVTFIHGGYAILGGCTVGQLNIWFLDAPISLDPLDVTNGEKVLAISAHYDAVADRFLIAAGIMCEHVASSTIIWTTQPMSVDNDAREDHDVDDAVTAPWQFTCNWLLYWILLPLLLLYVAAVTAVVMNPPQTRRYLSAF